MSKDTRLVKKNDFNLSGFVVNPLRLNTTQGGHKVCNLILKTDPEGTKAKVIKICAWNAVAEFCMKNITKGTPVVAEGFISSIDRGDSQYDISLNATLVQPQVFEDPRKVRQTNGSEL